MSEGKQVIPLTGQVFNLEPEVCEVKCPSCEATAISEMVKEKGTSWHHIAPCFWCLFTCCGANKCLQSWEDPGDLNHYCRNCGCYLGRYQKSSTE